MLTELLLFHETAIRLAMFVLSFLAFATWEILAPRRSLTHSKTARWGANLGVLALNSLLVRVFFPAAALGFAAVAEANKLGLLRFWEVPEALAVLVSVLLLDGAIYLQHLVFHALPLAWRLHRVHHADLDFDVTTGTRFHPIEILLSMSIKFVAIVTLGAPVIAVLIFETLLNVTALFNHANIRLPVALDRLLRGVIVTPDMHRIHHCAEPAESNTNFGFCFSFWDRLFGTYRGEPRLGHAGMTIGLAGVRDPRLTATLRGILRMPFAPATEASVPRQAGGDTVMEFFPGPR